MIARQLVKVRKSKFKGWLKPRFDDHKTALEEAEKTNVILKTIKHHWLVMSEFEADIVLAFSAALRYLLLAIVLRCLWDVFRH